MIHLKIVSRSVPDSDSVWFRPNRSSWLDSFTLRIQLEVEWAKYVFGMLDEPPASWCRRAPVRLISAVAESCLLRLRLRRLRVAPVGCRSASRNRTRVCLFTDRQPDGQNVGYSEHRKAVCQ